jgi:hypothetical protein
VSGDIERNRGVEGQPRFALKLSLEKLNDPCRCAQQSRRPHGSASSEWGSHATRPTNEKQMLVLRAIAHRKGASLLAARLFEN